jgi:hypothetical protein
MRRAVRDYKYEVNEDKMTEECSQYLAQLQKDWERHRVKLGVEALRKEVSNPLHSQSLPPPSSNTRYSRLTNAIVMIANARLPPTLNLGLTRAFPMHR